MYMHMVLNLLSVSKDQETRRVERKGGHFYSQWLKLINTVGSLYYRHHEDVQLKVS